MDLDSFLSQKPLYYTEIDYERMPRIYAKIKSVLNTPKIIHIIGTNGKGTTGRFLASALHSLGYDVGHYTSPHILRFNERIWLRGNDVSDEILQKAHQKLLSVLDKVDASALSYFEYTTLLAMVVYEGCEFVVMEAGLGGEHDATAVFDKVLTLVTPISYDHEAFLGDDIKQIAKTKLNAIQKYTITAKQSKEVMDVINSYDKNIRSYEEFLDASDNMKIDSVVEMLSLPSYLKENLSLAVSALKFFGIEYTQSNFGNARFFGRMTYFKNNIILDVGHNPLAASQICKTLAKHKVVLIYNSYKDKNYEKILMILKPILKRVEIISIADNRVESAEKIQNTLIKLGIECRSFNGINSNELYLVFGSFRVVEVFLKRFGNG